MLDHVGVPVSDLARSKALYLRALAVSTPRFRFIGRADAATGYWEGE